MANDQDTFHADLSELLTILGMGDHSRPYSPHEVFQEALGVLRERLSLPAPTPTPPCLGEREAVARTERVTLAECPVGLFLADSGALCLKTEYGNNEGRIDAYIVESGEFFWGGPPQTIASQRRQMVRPVSADLRAENEKLRAELSRALERAKEAEEGTQDACYKADCAEEYECDALGRAEQAEEKLVTLRAERDAAQTEVTKLCYRVAQMHQDWAKEGIEWLRSSDIDRLQAEDTARAVEGWQPIETVPKDGNDVLLWVSGIPMVAYWLTHLSKTPGWYISDGHTSHRLAAGTPTHWRLFPLPPDLIFDKDAADANR